MTTPRDCLAYIGLGLMGEPMVRHLRSLDFGVSGYDIVPERTQACVAHGARAATSPADAVRGASFVLLNLPTTEAVEQAVFSEEGVASALVPPQLVIDFSTIKVNKARAFAAALREQTDCGWVDAPVSGGPPASGTGTLTVMAGGDADDIARIAPLMAHLARRFTHMGPVGAGLVAKMINQLIVGCTTAALAEALLLAETAGIDAGRIPECLAEGYADSALLQRLYPRMADRDFAPQGYARQLLKDLEMVNEWAGALKAPVPMMAEALSLYRMLVLRGFAELDTAAIFKLYERGPQR
jgi:3-hydroxyisobutyrate dehydrogenase-like beta-hydroxyacid dehydrogenase